MIMIMTVNWVFYVHITILNDFVIILQNLVSKKSRPFQLDNFKTLPDFKALHFAGEVSNNHTLTCLSHKEGK